MLFFECHNKRLTPVRQIAMFRWRLNVHYCFYSLKSELNWRNSSRLSSGELSARKQLTAQQWFSYEQRIDKMRSTPDVRGRRISHQCFLFDLSLMSIAFVKFRLRIYSRMLFFPNRFSFIFCFMTKSFVVKKFTLLENYFFHLQIWFADSLKAKEEETL